jgi:general secretion pathway protein G
MSKTLPNTSRHSLRRGMTLIEVLVAVAIMALIATIVAFSAFQAAMDAKRQTARLSASALRRAAAVWRLNHPDDECPTFARLRADKVVDREASPADPWGSPYLIRCGDDDVTALSPGPDRRLGTPDDIIAPPETSVADSPANR